jgi:cytochrome c oxidase subunit 2
MATLPAWMTAACGNEAAASKGASSGDTEVISVVARTWEYSPGEIKLKKGVPVVLEITSMDVHHGFNLPEFNVRADAIPGTTSRVPLTPDKVGTFTFRCDFFCGDGHEDMQGTLTVE